MGSSQKEVPLNELKKIFVEKGYPESFFVWNTVIPFSYNSLHFEVKIPLVIKENSKIYFLVDYKPLEKLTFFERGILAVARLFFSPLPYFAIVTNLKEFALIDLHEFNVKKGDISIVPEYRGIKDYIPPQPKKFKPELEKKILAVYLSGG
ncbi:MAG: hypothetical protein GXO57_07050 [Thermodesulfobacteria bacterium]|nr:hypothetical protein [Thermodesulfobacteriota bacterium]